MGVCDPSGGDDDDDAAAGLKPAPPPRGHGAMEAKRFARWIRNGNPNEARRRHMAEVSFLLLGSRRGECAVNSRTSTVLCRKGVDGV